MRRARTQPRGFTLVELMTVVAIIGVLAAVIFGVSARQWGANAENTAEQLAQTMNFARTRALSTRRIHRVEVHLELADPELRIWQAAQAGMNRDNYDPTTAQFVERIRISKATKLWSAVAGPKAAGLSPSQSSAQFDIDFLPNGSATGATLYLADNGGKRQQRVLVYSITGSSYARTSW